MNRNQLAETVANAYFDQFVRGERVMNDVIIVYDVDTKNFSSQSSLTPLQEGEIVVDTLVDGGFGDIEASEKKLARWLASENDDYWNGIIDILSDFSPAQ